MDRNRSNNTRSEKLAFKRKMSQLVPEKPGNEMGRANEGSTTKFNTGTNKRPP